ncbi:3-hydroxydecanoyl-ACP dehydratase [Vibrio sp. MA40-2]|uniref:ApeP family dehydratase n=1 Tax=Vibrio sp. MA40-2 TaxID=3391828 RepID=UPI0039A53719
MKQIYPEIETLLPHRQPMILLNRVITHDASFIVCELDVTPESFLFESEINGVPAQVGLEYMAQTIATLGGLEAANVGEKPPIGFLLGTRRYQHIGGCFANGQTYQIQAKELVRDDNMAVYQCEIIGEDQSIIALGQVNTVIASDTMLKAMTNND